MIKLRTKVRDNHDQLFDAWIEEKHPLFSGPILVVQESTGRTAGKWRFPLVNLVGGGKWGNMLWIDKKLDWYLKDTRKLMKEAYIAGKTAGLVASEQKALTPPLVATELLRIASILVQASR